MANNYTLGRGELHFASFLANTQNPGGERYIGNTPEWNATIESENLEHYDSDHGIRELDESIVLQTNRNASFITDNISPENIANFFFGSVTALAVTAQTVDDEVIEGVIVGLTYQLGMTPTNPVGARMLNVYTPAVPPVPGPEAPAVNVIVEPSGGGTAFVEGTDYTIDLVRGRLTILADGAITSGTDIQVSYKTLASTRDRIISGSKPIEGALRYISFNPVGKQFDWYMPYVKLAPNGDYALKGDEWQQIPFNVQILKKAGLEAIYVDGSPLAA
jgi:hypothetical protein